MGVAPCLIFSTALVTDHLGRNNPKATNLEKYLKLVILIPPPNELIKLCF